MIDKKHFWQWAYSDFLSNAQRGVLAEFIVARAVGATDKPRKEWDAYDVVSPSGIKIEVKCSAYLQSWNQKELSAIRFDIARKKSWYAETNTYSAEASRSSDVYVFCLYAEKNDKSAEGPLALDRWQFWVCPTRLLDERLGDAKTLGLDTLEKLGLKKIGYVGLAAAIEIKGR